MEFDASQWLQWVVPGVGVLVAGLVLACGRWLLVPRQQASAPQLSPSQPQPEALPSKAIPHNPPPEDPVPPASNSERRKVIRRGGRPVAVLISDAEVKAQPHQGWVLDRSTNGLRIAATQAIPVGTRLSLRPSEAPDGVPWIQVGVTNCQRDHNNWEFGCRFARTPSWSSLLLYG